jgi:epoxyqueuosine reductase
MHSRSQYNITSKIINKAKSSGASLAGIIAVDNMMASPFYETYGEVKWPPEVKSFLVLALSHKPSEPKLDWWDEAEGGTDGNRELQNIGVTLEQWLNESFNIEAFILPYDVNSGGLFLKDAAVLSGLGILGKNNLLITQRFGPRVRLRAMALDIELPSLGQPDFSPCNTCNMSCWSACPQGAFIKGSYNRELCEQQMREDEKNRSSIGIKYCRACELSCIVGK